MGEMVGGTGEVELELTVPWFYWPDDDDLRPLAARPDAVIDRNGETVAVEFFTTYGESGDRAKLRQLLFDDNLAHQNEFFWKTPLSRKKIVQAYLQGFAVWKLRGCSAVEVINASTPPGNHRTVSVLRAASITIPFKPDLAFKLAATVAWQSGVVESGALSVKLNQSTVDFDALVKRMAKNVRDSGDPLSGVKVGGWRMAGGKAMVRKVGPVEVEPEKFVGGRGDLDDERATRNVSWRGRGPYRITVEPVAGLVAKYGVEVVEKLNRAWIADRKASDFKVGDIVSVKYPDREYDGEITEKRSDSLKVEWLDDDGQRHRNTIRIAVDVALHVARLARQAHVIVHEGRLERECFFEVAAQPEGLGDVLAHLSDQRLPERRVLGRPDAPRVVVDPRVLPGLVQVHAVVAALVLEGLHGAFRTCLDRLLGHKTGHLGEGLGRQRVDELQIIPVDVPRAGEAGRFPKLADGVERRGVSPCGRHARCR